MYKLILILFLVGCVGSYRPRLRGDCVDRAVMLRQSLKKQGFEARLVLGQISRDKGHCWVEYKDKNGNWKEINGN